MNAKNFHLIDSKAQEEIKETIVETFKKCLDSGDSVFVSRNQTRKLTGFAQSLVNMVLKSDFESGKLLAARKKIMNQRMRRAS